MLPISCSKLDKRLELISSLFALAPTEHAGCRAVQCQQRQRQVEPGVLSVNASPVRRCHQTLSQG